MTPRTRSVLRTLGAAVAAVACAAFAWSVRIAPAGSPPAALVAVAPLLAVASMLAWRERRRLPIVLACVLAAALAWNQRHALARHVAWIYLGEQIGVYGALAIWFGGSLGVRREALCTVWATRVHGPLDPPTRRYTRIVTLAWTSLFAMIVLALAALLVSTPGQALPTFASLGAFAAIVAMFVVEYRVRLRVLPQLPRVGILAGVRAYLASTGGSTRGSARDAIPLPRG